MISWEQRRETVFGSVSWYDLLGFQEAWAHQMDDLVAGLPRHDFYGVGREDGERAPGSSVPFSGIGTASSGSMPRRSGSVPTPKEAGSIGWDAELPRIATVVVLHDRQTGKVFRIINTHFSHVGEVAREASAQMLSMRMAGSSADVNLLLGTFQCRTRLGRADRADGRADGRCPQCRGQALS